MDPDIVVIIKMVQSLIYISLVKFFGWFSVIFSLVPDHFQNNTL